MSEQRRVGVPAVSLIAGVIIGFVEALLAVSFAAFVFGGRLVFSLDDGIGLYLGAAAITLAFVAWRAGSRGVVGGVQEATAAVIAVVATTTALDSYGSSEQVTALRRANCTRGQGYLFGRPMPPDDLEGLLRGSHRARTDPVLQDD